MLDSIDPDLLASSYTVCKGRAYQGSAGLGLRNWKLSTKMVKSATVKTYLRDMLPAPLIWVLYQQLLIHQSSFHLKKKREKYN